VYVTSSWFLVAVLIAVIVAPSVDNVQPGLGALKYLAGLAFAVILYGSVLLHEAAHAVAARRYGYGVGPITLHFLGGATELESEARRPRDEFVIAVVGPLTSLLVGGLAVLLAMTHPSGLLEMAIDGLAGANLIVGVLNLVPGLPLDGGRVLKAVVWSVTKDVNRGTLAAGWGGRVAAVAVIAWPFFQEAVLDRPAGLYDYVMAVIIASFLWTGASAAMASARVRSRLPQLVGRTFARPTLAVPGDLPLAEAVRRAQEARTGAIVTITGDGRPVGIVNEAALHAVPLERRPWVPTSSVARAITDGLILPATIHGEELIRSLQRTPSTEYLLVEEDGGILGVLATADVDAAFRRASH
jgi:Zn-dependent protease